MSTKTCYCIVLYCIVLYVWLAIIWSCIKPWVPQPDVLDATPGVVPIPSTLRAIPVLNPTNHISDWLVGLLWHFRVLQTCFIPFPLPSTTWWFRFLFRHVLNPIWYLFIQSPHGDYDSTTAVLIPLYIIAGLVIHSGNQHTTSQDRH